MFVTSRKGQLQVFYFISLVMMVYLLNFITRNRSIPEMVQNNTTVVVRKSNTTRIKKYFRAPRNLDELKKEAASALATCSCRSNLKRSWMDKFTWKTLVVPNILHIVR